MNVAVRYLFNSQLLFSQKIIERANENISPGTLVTANAKGWVSKREKNVSLHRLGCWSSLLGV